MKVTKYLPILAVCLMTTGCNSKKEAVLTSGIDLANLDTTAVYKFLSICVWRLGERSPVD